ncbi:pyranose dehydrogenase [Rhypophila decipiens]|uniref:Pyranose dehydrogenase n=1 Tax=Rhypophila decipiens TaxID=261697 RepID=A0AAN7B373_9PEZI|nr:pyranose dehydrogenase [Rhypophila decipiens]
MMAPYNSFQAALVGLLCLSGVSTSLTVPAFDSISHSQIFERGEDLGAEYDYIVVGGGTAGLTVADRLTESGRYSVLVIEIGRYENGTSVTTASQGIYGFLDSTLQFNIPSVPQADLNNRTIGVIVGKVLGGSSAVNGLQVMRGQKADYDRWNKYFGGGSWGWNAILPYFKKAWRLYPPTPEFVSTNYKVKWNTKYWGSVGKLAASFPKYAFPFQNELLKAMDEIPGVKFAEDSGSGDVGVWWHPSSVDPATWQRSFARPAHWDGVETRSNYDTLVSHKVTKVIFQGTTAKGVQYIPASATTLAGARTVRAKKEIILSAGTIHTPQILQASGVGPKALLRQANIPVVKDLPGVGANFQDHWFQLGAQYTFAKFRPTFQGPNDLYSNATFLAEAQAQFAQNFSGPLSIASGSAAGWFPFRTIAPDTYKSIADRYEAQNPAAYLPPGTDKTVIAGYQAQKKATAALLRSKDAATYNLFIRGDESEGGPVYLHPVSRGFVNINPADPIFAPPLVDYRALSNPADIDILYEFTKFTRKFYAETSIKKWEPVETAPGLGVTTKDGVAEYMRATLTPSVFHPVGTASMLPLKYGGVVDQKLKVYGLKGLSVADASVMPDLPGAYTQETAYVIGEKAADLIKARA